MHLAPPYTLIYSDSDIVLLNKASGVSVTQDRYDKSLLPLSEIAKKEFGTLLPVHRIDKETSGVILYARNTEAQRVLSAQFMEHSIKKEYYAIVNGCPSWKTIECSYSLLVDSPKTHKTRYLLKDKNKRIGGKTPLTSFTTFEVLAKFSRYALIKAAPKTGRTHQIRCHLKALGFPILCDTLYSKDAAPLYLSAIKRKYNLSKVKNKGKEVEDVKEMLISIERKKEKKEEGLERPLLNRLALHAATLTFTHPATNKTLTFTAPFPRDFQAVLKQIKKLYSLNLNL